MQMLDESDLLHTATGIDAKNSAASSLTHSGRFNSDKGSQGDLISLDGDDFDGGNPNVKHESIPSEQLDSAQKFGFLSQNKKLKKEERQRQ